MIQEITSEYERNEILILLWTEVVGRGRWYCMTWRSFFGGAGMEVSLLSDRSLGNPQRVKCLKIFETGLSVHVPRLFEEKNGDHAKTNMGIFKRCANQ